MKVYNEELSQILTNYDLNVGYLAEKDFDNEHIYIYKLYTEQELKQSKIQELKNWYDIYYAQHEQKYRRLHSLGKLTDEGKDPYNELINLYNEAEIKRTRIQELERLLSDNSK